nr:glutathione S-transferase family protein [Spirulina major]
METETIMLLLQFSTSHYCRKARLMLGFKGITYDVENLTPGAHILRLKPLTGLTTVPVLCPSGTADGEAIADSTAIAQYLDQHYPDPPLFCGDPEGDRQVQWLEDWLDESIGVATRFVYYDYRAQDGKHLDTSWVNGLVIQLVCRQYNINAAAVRLARQRLDLALNQVLTPWQTGPFLVGDRYTLADLTAAALLAPLAIVPPYLEQYPWLWERIAAVHEHCSEMLPPRVQG